MTDWLNIHSAAVQALAAVASVLLTGALVWVTSRYAEITNQILGESRKSREAAEKSAEAAQENLRLLKRQYESLVGLGPHRIREAVLSTSETLNYCMRYVSPRTWNPNLIPNPEDLNGRDLDVVRGQARAVSHRCVEHLIRAIVYLRNAKNEFEKLRSAPSLGSRVPSLDVDPGSFLMLADESLKAIVAELQDERPPLLLPEDMI